MSTSSTASLLTEAQPPKDVAPEATAETTPPKRSWVTPYSVAYVVLLLVAAGMRFWDLGAKALHHDESLHATYSWYLFSGSGYRHDPMMHGPFQFFANAGFFQLLGDSDYTVRVAAAVSGIGLVALPLLLKRHLGRSGALATAVLMAFSPTLLYYSRFSREDIYFGLWTLLFVAALWLYLDTRKVRYLALGSLALVLMFTVMEGAYLVAAVLGFYLFLVAIMDVVPWLLGRKSLKDFSPAGNFLMMMITVSLPLWAAGVSLLQHPLGIVLANPDGSKAAIGIPIGPGLYVAFFVMLGLIATAVLVGLRWKAKVWLLCAGIFWGVWLVLFTTFFTNFWGGLGSGLWQSLGYWIAQQGVARGGQPWYYYIVIGLNYEFLPLLLGTGAAVVYLIKRDRFGMFLAYWAGFTFLAFTYASEKMPWLLLLIVIPFILLTGKALGSLVDRKPWSRLAASPVVAEGKRRLGAIAWPAVGVTAAFAALVVAGGGVLIILLSRERDLPTLYLFVVANVAAAIGVIWLLLRVSGQKRWALLGVSLAVAMFGLTIPAAFRAAYANSDTPLEMLVYTQTAPDIPQIMKKIDQLAKETGKGKNLKIIVDSTSGFSWPWAWYLRDYKQVSYPCLSYGSGCSPLTSAPDADVVLLHQSSNANVVQYMGAYGDPVHYRHRWWFPESYRGMTPGGIVKAVQSRESMCKVVDYFVFREVGQPLGSEDGYAYFPKGFDVGTIGKPLPNQSMHC